jgi:hypothetical protein
MGLDASKRSGTGRDGRNNVHDGCCYQALTLKFRLLSIRFTSKRLSGIGR